MSLQKKYEKHKKEKKKQRIKELEETKVNKRAEVNIRCDKTGRQFIPDCDFKKYAEGKSEVQSPHTGEKFKVTSIRTDNEEYMKIGLLGTEEEGLANKLDDGKFKDSSKGQKSWNNTLLTLAMVFNAWLLFVWIQGWDFEARLMESRLFLVSLTATVTLSLTMFYIERKHQQNDNWYFLDGMCVGHSEDKEMHYVIATSDDNYIDHLKAWYGELDMSVKQALEDLGKDYQEQIDNLEDQYREKKVELDLEKERSAEEVAEAYEENRVNNEYRRKQQRTSVIKAVGLTALIMLLGFISILYMTGAL